MSSPQPIRERFHVATSDGVPTGKAPSEGLARGLEELTEAFRQQLLTAAATAEQALRQDVADALNEEFDEKFKAGVQMVRQEMEERMAAAAAESEEERQELNRKMAAALAEWDHQRQELTQEIEHLKQVGNTHAIIDEIEQTEAAVGKAAEEVAKMVEDPNIRLSDVMRKKSECAELAAYLRGLVFRKTD